MSVLRRSSLGTDHQLPCIWTPLMPVSSQSNGACIILYDLKGLTLLLFTQTTSIWHIKVVPLLSLSITFRRSMTTTRSFNQPVEAPQFASNLSLQAVLTPFGWQNLVLMVIHCLELSCSPWMEGISGTWEHMHLETQQSWSVLIIWTMWVHAYMIIYL